MAAARRADLLTDDTPPCSVLIAAADVLPLLTERIDTIGRELITFTDADALRALETIVTRRPSVVALERLFAATPRGAALINRIKADPSLAASEIRVVSHDSDYTRVSRPGITTPPAPPPAAATPAVTRPSRPATPAHPAPLDQQGTRRAHRYAIAGDVTVLVDGNPARLIDLSAVGAQVMSATVLKPNQRVRMALTDEAAAIRFNAVVAWALFEIPAGGARYRAGIEFVDADVDAVATFCARHSHS